jgi:hypothetical protein
MRHTWELFAARAGVYSDPDLALEALHQRP